MEASWRWYGTSETRHCQENFVQHKVHVAGQVSYIYIQFLVSQENKVLVAGKRHGEITLNQNVQL